MIIGVSSTLVPAIAGMQIRFLFSTDSLAAADQIDAMLAQLRLLCQVHQIDDPSPAVQLGDDHQVTVGIDMLVEETNVREDPEWIEHAVGMATAAVSVFAALAAEFGVAWELGHEWEPRLGTVDDRSPSPELIEEIRTTFLVANTLSEMIVDDEFVEPEVCEPESSLDVSAELGDDPSWNDLLGTEDSFLRFPEFE